MSHQCHWTDFNNCFSVMNETARVVFGSVEVCTGKYPVGSGQWVANDGRKSKKLGQRSQTIFFSLNDGALLDQQLSINQEENSKAALSYISKNHKKSVTISNMQPGQGHMEITGLISLKLHNSANTRIVRNHETRTSRFL